VESKDLTLGGHTQSGKILRLYYGRRALRPSDQHSCSICSLQISRSGQKLKILLIFEKAVIFYSETIFNRNKKPMNFQSIVDVFFVCSCNLLLTKPVKHALIFLCMLQVAFFRRSFHRNGPVIAGWRKLFLQNIGGYFF
jgi:hypothetical protein